MKRFKHKNRVLVLSRILIGAAIIIAVTGALILGKQLKDNRAARAERDTAHHEYPAAPSTTRPAPSEFDTYQVPADNPRYLFIPTLSVKAMVKPLGVDAHNKLNAPTNVFDVGWYNKSARPGMPGVMVMDGHVSSWTAHGVFYELKKVKIGQLLGVERGDGTKFTYRVVKKQVYDAAHVDMQAVLQPVSAKPGLNLITCDGNVIKGTNNFAERLVIFAEQSDPYM